MPEPKDHYAAYMAERREQLEQEDWPFWVIHSDAGCPPEHQQLDGLALVPQHSFWRSFFPPLTGDCGCYVSGARSERGVRRLGGDPDKKIPDWCKL